MNSFNISSKLPAQLQQALTRPDLIEAELARRDLNVFATLMLQMVPARHHRFMNAKLIAVLEGAVKRLMLFMPPGHAKSTYASWLFPAYYFGWRPSQNLIGVSHTWQNAARWGRKVQNLFRLPEWPFEVGLGEKQGQDEWETDQGGEYFAVGSNGAITGRRADLAIIDDPIKGREDADSPTMREKLWDWYRADFHSRLKPHAAIILIQTRWHEDDLAGRILPEGYAGESGTFVGRDGETWDVVSLPAFAEPNDALGRKVGDALWPGWFPPDMLEAERHVQGERNWSALYQQRPSPLEGAFFRREWLHWYLEPPKTETLRLYGASDYALTADGGDFTVHGVIGVDADDNLYILDWWRAQVDSAQAVDAWAHMAGKWRPAQWAEDKAQIEKALGPFLDKRQRELKIYCHREKYPTVGDKAMRAQSIRGRASQGKVYLPSHAPWIDDLVSELMVFPNGVHDDQVDVMSLFGRMVNEMQPVRSGHTGAPSVEREYDVHRW